MKKKDLLLTFGNSEELQVDNSEISFNSYEQLKKHVLSLNSSNEQWVFSGDFSNSDLPFSSIEKYVQNTEKRKTLLFSMLEEFQHTSPLFLQSSKLPFNKNTIEWLAVMHYYDVPTNILQWTNSPLIGIYQSLNKKDFSTLTSKKSNYALYALNKTAIFEISRQILTKEKIKINTLKDIQSSSFSEQINSVLFENNINFILPFNPLRKTLSFLAQQSSLTLVGNVNASFTENLASIIIYANKQKMEFPNGLFSKIVISSSMQQEIEEDCFQMNITSRTLNPGIKGFAQSLTQYMNKF